MKRYIVSTLLLVLLITMGCAIIEEPKTADSSLLVGKLEPPPLSSSVTYQITVSTPSGVKRYAANVDYKGFFRIPNIDPGEYIVYDFLQSITLSRSDFPGLPSSAPIQLSRSSGIGQKAKNKLRAFRFKVSPGEINYMGFINFDVSWQDVVITKEGREEALKWLIEKYPDSSWAIMAKSQLRGL